MNADRIHILHRADRNRVTCLVADNLELDLFPTCNTLLNEDLCDRASSKTCTCCLVKFFLRICDTAACSSQCERRSDDYRKTDLLSELLSILDGSNNLGRDAGLTDGFHRILEDLAVLSLIDTLRRRTEKSYVMLIKEAALGKLHAKRKCRLSAKT